MEKVDLEVLSVNEGARTWDRQDARRRWGRRKRGERPSSLGTATSGSASARLTTGTLGVGDGHPQGRVGGSRKCGDDIAEATGA